jgi:hypothetical protein
MKAYLPVIASALLIVLSFFVPFPLCVFVAIFAAIIPLASYILVVMISKLTPAWEFVCAKMSGGMVLAILRRDRSGAVKRFVPKLNTIYTKNHGAIKVNPETVYNVGVPFAIAPGNVGVGVKPEYGQLTKDLTDAGVEDLRDLATSDLMGRPVKLGEMEDYTVPVEVKNPDGTVTIERKQMFIPPRITGEKLKSLLGKLEIRSETVSMDDLWKYVQRNVHPGYTDVDIKVGVAKEKFGGEQTKYIWYILAAGIAAFLICLGAYVVLQYHATPPAQFIKDNLGNIVQV